MTPLRLALPKPFPGRIGVLDELKGLAILLIILYHAGGVLIMRDVLHGETGVDMFVILSGIGLTLSTTVESAGRFLVRRFWRIYPAYWVVLTVFLVADALLLGRRFEAQDIVLHYLGIHAWFGDGSAMSINDSFWFITLIVTLYALYVPLRRFVGRADELLFFGAAIAFGLAIAYNKAGQSVCFSHLSLRIPGFFIGLLVGRLLKTGSLEIPLTPALGAAFLLIFYLPYTYGFIFSSVWVGAALMALYAFMVRGILGAPVRRGLKYLGDHSLGIFLIHQPLIREYNRYVLERWFPADLLNPWALTAGILVGLVVTLELSVGLDWLLSKLPGPGPRGARAAAA